MTCARMDKLPNELLEKIFSFVTDEESLWACRRVCRRWNQVAVRFWRQLYSRRPAFLTDQLMHEFISDTDGRIQDFPFSRLRFKNLDTENISAAMHLLRECKKYIVDIQICKIQKSLDGNEEDGAQFQSFLNCLDISVMPNLEELSLTTSWFPNLIQPAPKLNLNNLRVLRLPFGNTPLEPLPASLVESAPNLQLLQTILPGRLCLTDPPSVIWPFPEEYRRIRVIEVKLILKFPSIFISIAHLVTLSQKFEEWQNVKVTDLSISTGRAGLNVNDIVEAKTCLTRILESQAQTIKCLDVSPNPGPPLPIVAQFPAMPKLALLDISFHNDRHPITEIIGNPFSNLQSVSLHGFYQPTNVFRTAVFDSVKIFHLFDNGMSYKDRCTTDRFTNFSRTFPNLVAFTYVNLNSNDDVNEEHVSFLVSTMRMDSLKHVKYVLGPVRKRRADKCQFDVKRRINQIFAGFRDLETVIEAANEARERGVESEETFWEEVEEFRNPSLANMTGLKSFSLDFPIDDNFARGILLRMKPLDLLTVSSSMLSLLVFCKVIARHQSFCSIPPPDLVDSPGRPTRTYT